MSIITNFNDFKKHRNKINETVYQVGDMYHVNIICEVSAKIITAYAKKVEQNTGKKLSTMFGDTQIAEELVKWVVKEGLKDVENIPATVIIGGSQTTSQGQGQVQTTTQPIQGQGQGQGQAQPQSQGQPAQVQPAQGQAQSPPPAQSQPAQNNTEKFEPVEGTEK